MYGANALLMMNRLRRAPSIGCTNSPSDMVRENLPLVMHDTHGLERDSATPTALLCWCSHDLEREAGITSQEEFVVDLGISLPTSGPSASPASIRRVAEEAERIGLASVWTYERLLRPAEPMMLGVGPIPLPDSSASVFDPLEALSFVAACTSRVKLGTSVIDILFHNPVVLARRLASVDQLSGGRLIVGLGQGWMEQEFRAAGVPPRRRGTGFEEHLAAMRAVWGPDPVRFDGRFYHIPEAQIGPKPLQSGGPMLLIGAGAPVALERAARLGLGLTHVMFGWDILRDALGVFRRAAEAAGHDPSGLPIVVQVNGSVGFEAGDDRVPLTGSVAQVLADLEQLKQLGVRNVFWSVLDTAPDAHLEAAEQLLAQIRL
jgi:probable F420-dependent oxidoreductase